MMLRQETVEGLVGNAAAETDKGFEGLRVCVLSEGMTEKPDEGIRKFASSIVPALGRRCDVLGMSINGDPGNLDMASARVNKLFLNLGLWKEIRRFAPDVICYIPTASDTIFSLIRLRMISMPFRNAATVLVALQPRPHGGIGRHLAKRLSPDLILVQSMARATELRALGMSVDRLPSGVDLERFRPVSEERRKALRIKYGLPQDRFLVLHVGHITRQRNIEMLVELQRRCQVVVVSGESVGEDVKLASALSDSGVIVFGDYLESVEEIYQAADCYIFPVLSDQGSIEFPLSVLEAMACNLPVVTTLFGGLKDVVSDINSHADAGFFMTSEAEQLPDLVAQVKNMTSVSTRDLAAPFSWENVVDRLLEEFARSRQMRMMKA